MQSHAQYDRGGAEQDAGYHPAWARAVARIRRRLTAERAGDWNVEAGENVNPGLAAWHPEGARSDMKEKLRQALV
ncbi:MAG TPA: hypothetical protein VKX16_12315, partial [Chloroflexota bacterium]|nr:hypothetical protein [Chloroflexota bacterium]